MKATPIRKEVDDAVYIRCTGLIRYSELMNNSLVIFGEKVCSLEMLYGYASTKVLMM